MKTTQNMKTKQNETIQHNNNTLKQNNNDNTNTKTVIQKNNILNYYSCNTRTKQTTQLNNTVDNVNSKSDNNINAKQNNFSNSKSDNNITAKQNNISKAPDFVIQNRSRILEKARLRRTEKLESSRADSAISDGTCIASTLAVNRRFFSFFDRDAMIKSN